MMTTELAYAESRSSAVRPDRLTGVVHRADLIFQRADTVNAVLEVSMVDSRYFFSGARISPLARRVSGWGSSRLVTACAGSLDRPG
jgi:hypothetical protein